MAKPRGVVELTVLIEDYSWTTRGRGGRESARKSKTQGQPFKNDVTSQLARLIGERT